MQRYLVQRYIFSCCLLLLAQIRNERTSDKVTAIRNGRHCWAHRKWILSRHYLDDLRKLRFEVDAQCSPGCDLSAFIAKHIETAWFTPIQSQLRLRFYPSLQLPLALTKPEPGTTIACLIVPQLFCLWQLQLAARISSIRELVHEPINTRI